MRLGIIGGSGLYQVEGVEVLDEESPATPLGDASDALVHAQMGSHDLWFLPRHGRGHRLLPSEINHRANILALKQLGVECILSVTAVGSLKEELRPGDICLPDQYFDRTKQSHEHTYFGNGLVGHVGFGNPVCPTLHAHLVTTIKRVIENSDTRLQAGGTYVNMEGPAFSTRAESESYRAQGFDVIGMTSLPEAKLAREAEICYAPMAMVTDYDCWHESEEDVSAEAVLATVKKNTALAHTILKETIQGLESRGSCGCANALQGAIMTDPTVIPGSTREQLQAIVGRYL